MGSKSKKEATAAIVENNTLGPRPELRWIKLSELYVPTEYQRSTRSDASIKNLNHIKSNFNWADCGALIVCPLAKSKPPQYAIIDGQHRFRAAETHGGIEELPCVVIGERESTAQAGTFIAINSKRVTLHPLQQYHAAVVAGDADSVSLQTILKKCDIEMAAHTFSSRDLHPRITQAVGTLLRMIQNYSEKQMVWVLTIIPEAYGEETGMLRASLIKLLAQFLKAHPDTDRARMICVLQDMDFNELEKDARTYRQIQGGSTAAALMTVLEKRYAAAKRVA